MISYTGSGPYCYSNSLAMILGADSPGPQTIEVLTGAPFGMQLIAGRLPMFDPYGWDPDLGLDQAIGLLGYTDERGSGGEAAEAVERLRAAVAESPVIVGPIEMGLFAHQPGMTGAIGADHWAVVLEVGDDTVLLHDPQGHPYATLPLKRFTEAWRADSIPWCEPFVMRSGFRRVRDVADVDALRAALPAAIRWLSNGEDHEVPPGTLGGGDGALRLAEQVEEGLPADVHGTLVHFAIRVGARRLNDGATALARLGIDEAARIAAGQSRLVGALQYPLVAGDTAAAAGILRELAPTYARLRDALVSVKP